MGERSVAAVKGPPPALMKWVALRSGLRWPRNLKSTPELSRAIAEDDLGCDESAFDERVKAATNRLEMIGAGRQWATTHPFFGPMTAADWMRWGYLHRDHHLRQFGR